MSEWQPIDSAPKDGTAILGFQRLRTRQSLWVIAPMYSEGGPWKILQFHDDNHEHEMQPTHWMPIPEPPEQTP